ncbi:Diphthamide biosynthesis protein 2 [Venturia nashicola]|uniref:Diphthamide biosynthesis protein 2 n=1 Tax=Venturia nashicola TaxID=86259 RepID=A0A4Z1PN77_9PEZI|nr:Diphthamide biosynthesis protein 2 [Venturia nashicola]
MKSFAIFSLLSALAVEGMIVLPPNINSTEFYHQIGQKRQALGALTSLMGKGGKVADVPGATPRKQLIKSDSLVPGVKRIKMRYGPYKVPNMNTKGLTGEAGSLWNYPDTNIAKPCAECTIVSQFAGLEYPDGSSANIDSGLWLHHMVHFTIGSGRWDPTFAGSPSLPHADVGASPMNAERYFSSGNERTKIRIDEAGADGTKYGYHLKTSDRFAFIVDLMNMNMVDKTVYMTMTYDVIDGALPSGWRDIKVVWFDAAQCGTSEVSAYKQTGKYTIPTRPWTPNFDGDIIGVGAHVHDGGANILITSGGSKPACDAKVNYGESEEYIFKKEMRMGEGKNYAERHISSISACYNGNLGTRRLEKSQSWKLGCNYDYDQYPGNRGDSGKQESVMCIAIMYVAVPAGGATPSRAAAGGGRGGGRGGG